MEDMEEVEVKVKKDENEALETSLAERSICLMKAPSLVSRSLQPLPFPDDPYLPDAKVILNVDPIAPGDEEAKFVMELARAEPGMPRRYNLDMSKDFIPMNVFCESSEGKTSVEGKIKNKFDMRPHNESIESYGRLCRERTDKYMGKNRQIQVIDNARGMHMMPMPMIIPTATPEKKKLTNKTSEMKRTRRGRREMEEVMFNLFERQSNWTLRQLIQETDQPEENVDLAQQFLKDLLRDLCIYNNKGSKQGTYELKPEYKKAAQD